MVKLKRQKGENETGGKRRLKGEKN